MAGPWEDYGGEAKAGPWLDYAQGEEAAPVSAGGLYKALDAGVARGMAGVMGLPRDLANLASAAAGKTPEEAAASDYFKAPLPSTESAQGAIQKQYYGGAAPYEPQNMPERFASTGGEFASNAMFPGGAVSRIASVAAPAVATQTVKEMGGGPVAETAASLAGGMAASKLGSIAERAAATALPKIADVEKEASIIYRAVEELTVGKPYPVGERTTFLMNLKDNLNVRNFRPGNVEGVYKEIEKFPASADVADLVNLQKGLASLTGREGAAARAVAIPMIEAEIERLAPQAGKALSQADQNWNAFKVASGLDKKMARAELQAAGTASGTNLGNKLRQAATAAATGPESRFMKPSDIAALEAISRGTTVQNTLRRYGNLVGGGVGLGGLAAGALGGAYSSGGPEGGLYGGPLGMAGVMLAGRGLRGGYNRAVANQAGELQKQVLARSPMAREIGARYVPKAGWSPALGLGGISGLQRAQQGGLLDLE